MKIRVNTEDGLELSTICRQLKLKASDGKMRKMDVVLHKFVETINSK